MNDLFVQECLKHDKDLRRRVRLLGNLLGAVLLTQEGAQTFSTVERLRKGYINLRKRPDPQRRQRLQRLIERLSPQALTPVIRAFSVYFSLANIAEEGFQHRQRRRIAGRGGELWEGSFDHTLQRFREQGISPQELQQILHHTRYIPVFTAHPTEAKRRTIMHQLRRVFVANARMEDPRQILNQRETRMGELRTLIQTLWKTEEIRTVRPEVRHEIHLGLHYFHESLFDAIPQLFRNLDTAIERNYGDHPDYRATPLPTLLRFGSWIGGDRDGNPNVTPTTTRYALRRQHQTILQEYVERVDALIAVLTHSDRFCTPAAAFLQGLTQDEAAFPEVDGAGPTRFIDEPYRRKLYLMRERLRRNLAVVNARLANQEIAALAPGYPSEREFLHDLESIRDSLISHGDAEAADGALLDLCRLVQTFGFYLARLDIRQESAVHSAAVAEIIGSLPELPTYEALDESGRLALLGQLIQEKTFTDLDPSRLSSQTRGVLEVFEVIAALREEISPQAVGQYVISMAHSASHVMEVLFLGRLAGLAGRHDGRWFCHLEVSPLFETIDDLAHIEPLLGRLFDDPCYRVLLAAAEDRQEVMLGYSDSAKDGGIMASGWNLYEAQKKIMAMADARAIRCRLFHGRGGTVGRGGGPTHQAILAQPAGTVRGEIKFTEQGEVLSNKYSNPETAIFELSMGITGLFKASIGLVRPVVEDRRDFLGTMDELATLGERHYRELTERTPGFLDYFYEATPVNEIGLLNIGSRPSHRNRGDRSKASVRAIAWVFGWAQARHTLPGWYGIGYALERWREDPSVGLVRLQKMYNEWPFFRALLSNAQMALFKADMDIAEEYAELCLDEAVRQRVFDAIREEFNRTRRQILDVAGIHGLLEETPLLHQSLLRRDPYLDPLNHIQLALLRRYRDPTLSDEEREAVLTPLLRSINAVAAGLRNTG